MSEGCGVSPDRREAAPGGAAPRGFISIDKPAGLTSFEVVRRVRRAAGTRKVGHAGTLDPIATGVLPLALGSATRLVGELVDARKRYLATVRLGLETDTYDAEGAAVATADASYLDGEAVAAALSAFEGEQWQTPPAFSAVKKGGEPAYRAARGGRPHALDPRPVVAYSLRLADVEVHEGCLDATIEVECGKGYYVRSLAHDLGAALGVGGHVAALCRTAVGPFTVESAVGVDEAVARLEAGDWERLVHAPDVVLESWSALILGPRLLGELQQGRELRPAVRNVQRAGRPGQRARCYDLDGRLVGLVRGAAQPAVWRPYRVFVS